MAVRSQDNLIGLLKVPVYVAIGLHFLRLCIRKSLTQVSKKKKKDGLPKWWDDPAVDMVLKPVREELQREIYRDVLQAMEKVVSKSRRGGFDFARNPKATEKLLQYYIEKHRHRPGDSNVAKHTESAVSIYFPTGVEENGKQVYRNFELRPHPEREEAK